MSSYKMVQCDDCGAYMEQSFHGGNTPSSTHVCDENDVTHDHTYTIVDVDIKPCPLCYHQAYISSDGGVQHFGVHCGCGISLVDYNHSPHGAKPVIDKWNNRI